MTEKNERLTFESVREIVEEYLDKNDFAAHAQLPPERQLSEMLGVNRVTMRKALAQMVNENKLYSVEGRGTFVAPKKYIESTGTHISFTDGWDAEGHNVQSKVISFKTIEASIKISQALEIALGARVYELVRLRCIDGDPVFIESSYISVSRCPDLDEHDFNGKLSLYAVLRDRYDIKITRQQQSIHIVKLTDEEIREFGDTKSDSAFRLVAVGCDADGVPVEHSISIVRADIYAISYMAGIAPNNHDQ